MKKVFLTLAGCLALIPLSAQTEKADSIRHVQLEEVFVSATRAGQNTPVSYTNIPKTELTKYSAARNIPAILQNTPSLVSFTEDGLGVGNTYMRIRGTDATRINVTLNGMPLNNPESQEVFWVNLPDLSSSLQNVQIQRGVGTSTNGSAAFGASISLKTSGAKSKAYGESSTAIGSYNTFTSTLAAGSGILKNGLSVDARYSRVLGDGYVRNGKVNHSNLYATLSHYSDNNIFRLSYIKGQQRTGITWEGVSIEQMNDPEYGRRYNPAGEYYDEAGNRLYYDNEIDKYDSDILQLSYSGLLTDELNWNVGLSYNHGRGYYENYKADRDYSEFGIENQVIDGVTLESSDVIRRKEMSNNFYVANTDLNYRKDKLDLTFGAMLSKYDGEHFGTLPWIKYLLELDRDNLSDYEWYRNTGVKSEFSTFAKAEYSINDRFTLFADVQFRHINYKFIGLDDDLMDLTSTFNYDFLNPKSGLFYRVDEKNTFYASVAVGQREPLRTDLKDGIKGGTVNPIKPEKMLDYEVGYRFSMLNGTILGANFYYMDYNNQMVQTGKLNDVGYKLMENVKDSYRTGIELEATVPFMSDRIRFDGNATFSRNKIINYTAYFDKYDTPDNYNYEGQVTEEFETTNISFSPNIISTAGITYQPSSNLYFNILGKYVSKQYMDNTRNDDRSIGSYFVSNFSTGYTFNKTPIGKISLQFFVNNIFNKEYVANGWAATDKFSDGSHINWIGYYPQAIRNYMGRITISF